MASPQKQNGVKPGDSNEGFYCYFCGKTFLSEDAYNPHLLIQHGEYRAPSTPRTYCKLCINHIDGIYDDWVCDDCKPLENLEENPTAIVYSNDYIRRNYGTISEEEKKRFYDKFIEPDAIIRNDGWTSQAEKKKHFDEVKKILDNQKY